MSCIASKAAFLTATLLLLPTASAHAVGECGVRQLMVDTLEQKFEENPIALGVASTGAVLEVFVSKKGTWTILATNTDGKSCVLSVGIGWDSSLMLASLPEA